MAAQTGTRVRIAMPDDAPQLLPLFAAFYGPYFDPKSEEAIRRQIVAAADVNVVLIACVGERLAGFASLRLIPQIESHRPHAELSDLFVDTRFRHRGVGRALVRFAEDAARRRGAKRIHLTVGKDNDGALAFYHKEGYDEHAFAMVRSLGGRP